MPTPNPAAPTRHPIPLPASAVLFAPGPDRLGVGHKLVMTTADGSRLTHDLHPALPVAESFPMLAHSLRSAVGLGARAHVVFHVEPIKPRR